MEHKYLSLEEILWGLKRREEPDPFYFDYKKKWHREVLDILNSDFDDETCSKVMVYIRFLRNKIQTMELADEELLLYIQKVKSSFCFNVLLVCVIENLMEQNDMDSAKEYAKLYRLDGLSELRQMRLHRVRHFASFKFDWFLRQCVYLECINKGLETDEDFQTLFNRQFAKPNIPHPYRELTIESIVEIMKL